jgi:hypothetical protein
MSIAKWLLAPPGLPSPSTCRLAPYADAEGVRLGAGVWLVQAVA